MGELFRCGIGVRTVFWGRVLGEGAYLRPRLGRVVDWTSAKGEICT